MLKSTTRDSSVTCIVNLITCCNSSKIFNSLSNAIISTLVTSLRLIALTMDSIQQRVLLVTMMLWKCSNCDLSVSVRNYSNCETAVSLQKKISLNSHALKVWSQIRKNEKNQDALFNDDASAHRIVLCSEISAKLLKALSFLQASSPYLGSKGVSYALDFR